MPTSEGAVSQSQNNNEDQNAPIVVNQGGTNTDTQQSTSHQNKKAKHEMASWASVIPRYRKNPLVF